MKKEEYRILNKYNLIIILYTGKWEEKELEKSCLAIMRKVVEYRQYTVILDCREAELLTGKKDVIIFKHFLIKSNLIKKIKSVAFLSKCPDNFFVKRVFINKRGVRPVKIRAFSSVMIALKWLFLIDFTKKDEFSASYMRNVLDEVKRIFQLFQLEIS